MAKGYVIYNPLAGNGSSGEDARLLEAVWEEELEFFDMTRITNYATFFAGMAPDDRIILAGGDGTLHRFANATADLPIPQEILYFPTGTGNDFALEMGKSALSTPFPISRYLKDLPTVEVKGKTYRFLNGVGFGVDGYCCQRGDELRKRSGKKVNYTAIAIRGLLFDFDARNAKVTVDGQEYRYEKVWIAPTMFGKYYGGGMQPAPAQNRLAPERTLSVLVFHGGGRLRTLCTFPGIFRGEHIKHTKMAAVHTGHEITVEFDRPTPLQIDGETIADVTAYTARLYPQK